MSDIRKEIEAKVDEVKHRQIQIAFKNVVATRIKTSFIFTLAEFEKLFGHLLDDSCDEVASAEDYQALFKIFRKSVLDNGNNQIRNLEKDLENYEVSIKKRMFYVKE